MSGRREHAAAVEGADASGFIPRQRVILLGASNLVRSLPTIVATAQRTWGEPVEILRSDGAWEVVWRGFSRLRAKNFWNFSLALWQDLQNRPAMPTAALVTDIGNDLLYGVPPGRLLGWIEDCLDRLADVGATTVVTQLPIGSVEGLSEARFRFYRRLLFPRSRLTLSDAKAMVRAFNERLVRLGEPRKMPVIPVLPAWYGLDPIHLKRRVLRRVWPELLTAWHGAEEPVVIARPSLWTTAYLATLAPWERSLFGIRRPAAQPSGRLIDGTTISLY